MGRLFVLLLLIIVINLFSCKYNTKRMLDIFNPFLSMREIQLTTNEKGHFLHTTQYFSPDNEWIVYDTRNDGAHIGRNCCIEIVNTQTKEIRQLYQTQGQTLFGPGVGAATFNPATNTVLFIHGLHNCNFTHPYGFSRRTGVAVSLNSPNHPVYMDARDVIAPFTPGALRGGTHAHTWSGDGNWISFTYNDDLIAKLEAKGNENLKDLRMVGVMAPYGPVKVKNEDSGENISGEMFTVIITDVTENPVPGSDQIQRAYEDGWVGYSGYVKNDGAKQERAVAFLGDVKTSQGEYVTEVFIVDIPDDITIQTPGKPLAGTQTTRPNSPAGTVRRRLTHTVDRKYPGVQGPRHWLRSLPDGSRIFFLMKDDEGTVQIYGISPNGGRIEQITKNNFSVETTFSVCPTGQYLAYGSKNKVYITHIQTGDTIPLSPEPHENIVELRAIHWSNNGKMIAYNKKVQHNDTSYYQVFILK